MKKIFFILCSLLLVHQLSQAAPINNEEAFIITPHTMAAGSPIGDWANIWWQWAVSLPDNANTISDKTGKYCGTNQTGPVWFLAGSYSTEKIRRTCTIPSGKFIFFPIVNVVTYPAKGVSNAVCANKIMEAAITASDAKNLRLRLNGKEIVNIKNYMETSFDCFNLLEKTGGKLFPSATAGYWIMLKPLSKGRHTIYFKGELVNGFSQDIEYHLQVE